MEAMAMPGKKVLILQNKSATGLLAIKLFQEKQFVLREDTPPEILKLYQDIK